MQGSNAPGVRPLLLLTQGHAGDRLGASLVPALRARFPERPVLALGGPRLRAGGAHLIARTDSISAMGYSGLLPQLPATLEAILAAVRATRSPLPACVIAVDVWQPLGVLHRFAPHLRGLPHLCYLPPGPNFIGISRVHAAVARLFGSIVTPFEHQRRLFAEAGGCVRLAGHAGLQVARAESPPLPPCGREPVLALLPGSRALEVRYSLPVQAAAAARIVAEHPELQPVVGCADRAVDAYVARCFPTLKRADNARALLARARFALICSGTAALEAAVLGCPGVITYNGSPLQRWEWRTFYVEKLARLRGAGIASPFVGLPNIIAGEELYPECLDRTDEEVARAALVGMQADPEQTRQALDAVANSLGWDDAGLVVAEETARLIG